MLLRPSLPAHSVRLSRSLASHAYVPPAPQRPPGPPGPPGPPPNIAGPSTPKPPNPATTLSPELPEAQRRLLEEVVRVDHAGELGANWIYRGQKWASQMRGDRVTAKQVEVRRLWLGAVLAGKLTLQGMWENERHHLSVLTRVAEQHRVRPTALYPVWQVLAWGLGASTALMGKEAAMACTEAVETVIGEHYDE